MVCPSCGSDGDRIVRHFVSAIASEVAALLRADLSELAPVVQPGLLGAKQVVASLGRSEQPEQNLVLRETIPLEGRLLVSRKEAAQLLSISPRGLDYLIERRELSPRRIGGRVMIPMASLKKYVSRDHPENIVT